MSIKDIKKFEFSGYGDLRIELLGEHLLQFAMCRITDHEYLTRVLNTLTQFR